jgi:hypothetical protein
MQLHNFNRDCSFGIKYSYDTIYSIKIITEFFYFFCFVSAQLFLIAIFLYHILLYYNIYVYMYYITIVL